MSGRRRDDDAGLIEMLWDLASMFPRVGIGAGLGIAAVGSYLIWFNPTAFFLASLVGLGLIVLAAALVLGGVAGLLKSVLRPNARPSHPAASLPQTIDAIHAMSWQQFENLIADLFRRQGYRVAHNGAVAAAEGHGDGGVDLIVSRGDGIDHLVQCKQYRAWKVGESKVREFFGAMAAYKTRCEGIFVTCGCFTAEAQRFAAGKPLRLIDGDEILKLLRSVNPLAPAVEAFTAPTAANINPTCPRCAMPMVRRVAKKGISQGRPFWGCSNYPKCTEIVRIN